MSTENKYRLLREVAVDVSRKFTCKIVYGYKDGYEYILVPTKFCEKAIEYLCYTYKMFSFKAGDEDGEGNTEILVKEV